MLAQTVRARQNAGSVHRKNPDQCKLSRPRDNKMGPSRMLRRRIPTACSYGTTLILRAGMAYPLVEAIFAPNSFAYRPVRTTQIAPAAFSADRAQDSAGLLLISTPLRRRQAAQKNSASQPYSRAAGQARPQFQCSFRPTGILLRLRLGRGDLQCLRSRRLVSIS